MYTIFGEISYHFENSRDSSNNFLNVIIRVLFMPFAMENSLRPWGDRGYVSNKSICFCNKSSLYSKILYLSLGTFITETTACSLNTVTKKLKRKKNNFTLVEECNLGTKLFMMIKILSKKWWKQKLWSELQFPGFFDILNAWKIFWTKLRYMNIKRVSAFTTNKPFCPSYVRLVYYRKKKSSFLFWNTPSIDLRFTTKKVCIA